MRQAALRRTTGHGPWPCIWLRSGSSGPKQADSTLGQGAVQVRPWFLLRQSDVGHVHPEVQRAP